MTIKTSKHALDGLVLFSPLLEIWSGTVSFNVKTEIPENIQEELPPDELATNGRLHLIPPKGHLSKLCSVRKGVERLLKEFGIPLLGGVAIPQAKVAHVIDELGKLEHEFEDKVTELVRDLPDLYGKQVEAHSKWTDTLTRRRLSPAKVRERCRFDVAVFEVADPASPAASARLRRVASTAFPKLLDDLAARAVEIFEESFFGREIVTQKAVNPVRRLVDKLDTFGFIDPRVGPMVTNLRTTLASLPKQGPLNRNEIAAVSTMLNTIASPERLLQFGESAIQLAHTVTQASLPIDVSPVLSETPSEVPEAACEDPEIADVPAPALAFAVGF